MELKEEDSKRIRKERGLDGMVIKNGNEKDRRREVRERRRQKRERSNQG